MEKSLPLILRLLATTEKQSSFKAQTRTTKVFFYWSSLGIEIMINEDPNPPVVVVEIEEDENSVIPVEELLVMRDPDDIFADIEDIFGIEVRR